MWNAFSIIPSSLLVVVAFVFAAFMPPSGGHDRGFLIQAEEAGNFEVAEGRLAEMRGRSNEVRMLGARMVHDHTLAGQRLAAIARSQGLPVTSSLGSSGYQQLSRARGLHGRAFDDFYVRSNVTDHEQVAMLLQHEIAAGRDPALRRWARQTLPVIRLHLHLFLAARSRL